MIRPLDECTMRAFCRCPDCLESRGWLSQRRRSIDLPHVDKRDTVHDLTRDDFQRNTPR
jgi:hypothetical protein